MEYNKEQEASSLLQERKGSSSQWVFWILAIVILALLAWYGSTQQWFGLDQHNLQSDDAMMMDDDMASDMEGTKVPQNLAPINSLAIIDAESFPVQKILVVKGDLPNGCTYINDPKQLRDGNVFFIQLTTRQEGELCTEALVPYEKNIPLNIQNLPSGVYLVNINGREMSFEIEMQNSLDLSAGEGK